MALSYFKDKVCIVTGSTQGIGRETARLILENGGLVTFNGRNPEKEELVKNIFHEFQDQLQYVAGDIGSPESSSEIINKTLERFGTLDIVINNGGMSSNGELRILNPTAIREVLESNLAGALYMSHYAIPHLIKSNGHLLFISSLAGLHGLKDYAPYSSVKMAYTAITQSLRKELHNTGVHIGISYLGFTQNDTQKKTLNANGHLESIPKRTRLKVHTQRETSILVLKQIINRKPIVVQSYFGKLLNILNRISPELVHKLIIQLNKD